MSLYDIFCRALLIDEWSIISGKNTCFIFCHLDDPYSSAWSHKLPMWIYKLSAWISCWDKRLPVLVLERAWIICGWSDPLQSLDTLANICIHSNQQSAGSIHFHYNIRCSHNWSMWPTSLWIPFISIALCCFLAKARELHTIVNEVIKYWLVLWKYNEEMTVTIGWGLCITLGALFFSS